MLDNNLLPASHETHDFVNDSYLLGYRPVLENGLIPLKVGEFENNTDYFDQMRLLAVAHSSQVKVGLSPSGQVLTYTNPMAPSYAQTDNGTNILPLLAQANGVYWQGTPGRYVIVKYAQVPRSSSYKLVVVSDGCYNYCKMSIHVQIRNQDGTWLDADVIHPRVYWSTDVVDLSRYLPSQNGGLQVRLFFTSDHKLDFVGLDTSSPAPIITTQLQMVSATHSSYGDASQALGKVDGSLVDITPGQKILLSFAAPPIPPQGQVTDFVMGTVGRYFLMKSGDTRGTHIGC